MEKYSIVEEDTLDKITELRSSFSLSYLRGSRLGDFFQLEGRALAGNNIYEGSGRLGLASSFRDFRWVVDMDGAVRSFRSSSDYAYPNDYARYNIRTYLKKKLTPFLSVRLSERLELLNFEQSTEFDQDYLKNSIRLSGDIDISLMTFAHVSIGYVNKSIPDSTQISYHGYVSQIDFRHQLDLHRYYSFNLGTERRSYAYKPNKSPYWLFLSDLTLIPLEHRNFTLGLENTLEYYDYDINSSVYFNYTENKTAVLAGYHPSFNITFKAGPTYSFFSSDYSADERYREFGGRLSAEYFHGSTAWISLAYEPGHRSYETYQSGDLESIYSDYTYHRLIGFASARIWKRFNLTAFLNYEPELHDEEGDDTTITLFSMNLAYSF